MMASSLHRCGVILASLCLSASVAWAQGAQLLVSNVQALQRPFTSIWDVTYDLETVGDIAVTVSLSLSTDSGTTYPHPCAAVAGDVGPGIAPGLARHMTWEAGADFPGLSSQTCRLRVTADDGQGAVPEGFVTIPSGTFMMGSPTTETGRGSQEDLHQVTLTRSYYMQATEVTNQQYRDMVQWAFDRGYVTVLGSWLRDNLDTSATALANVSSLPEVSFNSGVFSCVNPGHPVKWVTWYGAAAYCDWLNLRQDLPLAYDHGTWQCNAGNPYAAVGYRLPTEAEWEYACRAGTSTPFNTGVCLDADSEANYNGTSPYYGCLSGPYPAWTVPAGSYPANALGLHDMHGNVWEWCNDRLGVYVGAATDPVGPATGLRVLRGGSWSQSALHSRSATRYSQSGQDDDWGFRPVKTAP